MTKFTEATSEERVWAYLVKHPTASVEDVELNCDVSADFARHHMSRIGTPREVFEREAKEPGDPVRVRLLKRGIALTAGDRDKSYGPPYDNLDACAQMWSAYLTAKFGFPETFRFTAEDVGHMMQLVKMSRTFYGAYHEDNYVDNATFGAIAGECRAQEEGV
jgi:hypothetical protein